jgi:hypothetical protein
VAPSATMLVGSAVILSFAGAGGFLGLFISLNATTPADAAPMPTVAAAMTHSGVPS